MAKQTFHCMAPQGVGSLEGLTYLEPQNLLELIERWMRRSSDVLVPWDPISHCQLLYLLLFLMPPESSSFAVLTVSSSMFDNCHYSHPPISSFCPAPNFFLFSSSSPFIHPTSFVMLPCHTRSATPWKSLGFPALSWSANHLQQITLLASTSSAPSLLQRTPRSVQLRKAPKVTEHFHYGIEGTEVLRPHLQLNLSEYRRLLSLSWYPRSWALLLEPGLLDLLTSQAPFCWLETLQKGSFSSREPGKLTQFVKIALRIQEKNILS